MPTALPRSALLALLLTLAACEPAADPAQSAATAVPENPATEAPTSTASATCPDVDFAAFLKRFESSVDVQRASTADPLTMVSVDANAQLEPAPVERQVPLADVKFPIMFDANQRKAEGLEQVVHALAADRQGVTIRVPDMQMRYEFHANPAGSWSESAMTRSDAYG